MVNERRGILSLSASGKSEADPDWSADDSQLVFGNVLEEPQDAAIHTVDLKSRLVRTSHGSEGYFSPRRSPDGRSIAAVRISDRRLDFFDFASGKWANLTSMASGYPSWSHDGKSISCRHPPGKEGFGGLALPATRQRK